MKSLSIKSKLILMMVCVSLISLALGIGTIILFDTKSFNERVIDRTTLIAKTVGNYAAADIAFENPKAATETLSRLKENPEVIQASLYDKRGKWFAGYNTGQTLPLPDLNLNQIAPIIYQDRLILTVPIDTGEINWGYIQTTVSKGWLNKQIQERIRILIYLGLTLIFVSFLLAILMQRLISKPILDLTAIAKKISNEPEYDLRLPVYRKDEMGELFSAFNTMMQRIEKRKIERNLAEEELRKTNQILQGLIKASPLATILLAPNGEVRFWSPTAERLLGWSETEIMGSFFPAISEKSKERIIGVLNRISQGETIFGMETSCRTKAGDELYIALWGVRLFETQLDSDCLILLADITEKRKMEEEIVKIEKLESLGVLAGGIAHDFNNILTGILGNISLAKTLASLESGDLLSRLDDAEKASMRASQLAQQLLTFAKGGAPVKKTIVIPGFIENIVRFFLTGTSVQFHFLFEDNLWLVDIDEDQISQVIQNLVINAQQAMDSKGAIYIRAKNLLIEKTEPEQNPLEKGKYVELSIQDEGPGISKELQEKIFDPFFTTKPKGSGLGLSICYSIMRKHAGHIKVESETGKGTTFFLYLPASNRGADPAKFEEGLKKGKGRVLVMDDEEAVLAVISPMLEYLGYEVVIVPEGSIGIAEYLKWKNKDLPFDVVLTDLTVPGGIGGVEFLEKLKEIDPGVKVIVSSGYSNDPVIADYLTIGFSGFILKPYNLFDLSKVLYQVIFKG